MFLLDKSYYEIRDTKEKGKGVFAKKDIEAGTVIGDYLGKLIKFEDEESYEDKYGLYSMYYNEKATIFADQKSIGIHLINHSCSANCGMFPYGLRCLYFSIRKIFKGEELTVHYGISAPKSRLEKNYPCSCKSINCIGTMHVSNNKYKLKDNGEKTTTNTRNS